MEKCECCYRRNGSWYVIDDSIEQVLCGTCAKELRTQFDTVTKCEV